MVTICLALLCSNVRYVSAESFEGREDEMNQKCSAVTDTKTMEECKDYKKYLEDTAGNLDKQISDIKNQVASLSGDVDKMSKAITENTKSIKDYNAQITSLEANITTIQSNIASMNTQIDSKQKEIDERDRLMKARMVDIQAYIGSNSYIDFIMGSTSFADLLRRSEVVGELNSYENDQIKEVANEKKTLRDKQKIVEEQKNFLEVQKNDISDKKKVAEALNDSNTQLIAKYQSEQSNLNAKKIAAEMQSESIKASLPTIHTTIPPNFGGSGNQQGATPSPGETPTPGETPNPGETQPAPGGGDSSSLSSYLMVPMNRQYWNYYYGTWSYPGGGLHLGMDLSTGLRTRIPVVAPASGVILTTHSGCPEYGGLDNHCGLAWGGNAVIMAVQLTSGQSYVLSFYHLYAPSVSPGQLVTQGQQIGLSGSSGNSSGPHCHTEVINMGTQSLEQIIATWNRNKDPIFGLSWESPGACGSAPCRLRPESFYL